MDKGLNKAFEKLTDALQYTRDKDVISIKACVNVDRDGFHKEVARITFRNGLEIYADIGGDANTAAMYDVLAVLCLLKPKSKGIYKLTDIEEEDEEPEAVRSEPTSRWCIDIDNDTQMLRCKACGCRVIRLDYDRAVGDNGFKYCPYCGLFMENWQKMVVPYPGYWEKRGEQDADRDDSNQRS